LTETKSIDSDRLLLPLQLVVWANTAAVAGVIASLAELRNELGISESRIGLIVAAGFLTSFVAQVTLAPLADMGRGRMMAVVGTIVAALALASMARSEGFVSWLLSRGALGVGAGLVLPSMRRSATTLDPARSGEHLSRLVVAEILAFVFGPVVFALGIHFGGLRLPFAVFAGLMLLAVPVALRLPEDRGRKSTQRERSLPLLVNRRLRGALILVLGYFLLIGAFESLLPLMLDDRGSGPLMTGCAISLIALPILLVGRTAGRMADRHGGLAMAMVGMVVAAIGSGLYGVVPGVLPLMTVIAAVGIFDGFGFIGGQVVVSRSVPEERQAGALGLMGAAEVLGAGFAAYPSALLYERIDIGWLWVAISGASLSLLAIGFLHVRSTRPLSGPGR